MIRSLDSIWISKVLQIQKGPTSAQRLTKVFGKLSSTTLSIPIHLRLRGQAQVHQVLQAVSAHSSELPDFSASTSLLESFNHLTSVFLYIDFDSQPQADSPGAYKCITHTDCPPNWSCYTDLTCKDPCIHSIRCGKGSVCKYKDRRPYCECPLDFVGDPEKECFNTLQGKFT